MSIWPSSSAAFAAFLGVSMEFVALNNVPVRGLQSSAEAGA
jgi:hypothetical protein